MFTCLCIYVYMSSKQMYKGSSRVVVLARNQAYSKPKKEYKQAGWRTILKIYLNNNK